MFNISVILCATAGLPLLAFSIAVMWISGDNYKEVDIDITKDIPKPEVIKDAPLDIEEDLNFIRSKLDLILIRQEDTVYHPAEVINLEKTLAQQRQQLEMLQIQLA